VSDQRLLAATRPDARLVILPDAGHAMHWEEPERVARELMPFIASTAVSLR
jgi:pimeloyl-ACP methyl ester carboxylesterase